MNAKPDTGEFRFRKFSVRHDRCGMKVGTDGILLGAWVDVTGAQTILDIGTGCGLVALMLAQRNLAARIDAIEIDLEASRQAAENVAGSPWSDRVRVIHQSFQDFLSVVRTENVRYDRIVCNPPYFHGQVEAADSPRRIARHGVLLSPDELVAGAAALLEPTGRFSLILPLELADRVQLMACTAGLNSCRRTDVHSRPDLPPKRTLMEFGFGSAGQVTDSLVVENSKHAYSDAWRTLTGDFYL